MVSFLQLIWIHPLLSVGKDHFQTIPGTNYVTHKKSIQFISIDNFTVSIWNYYGYLVSMPAYMGTFPYRTGFKICANMEE
jgi:hypothetical protein